MFLASSTGWIGVDLGTHCVKLAQVERRGPRFRLKEAVIIRRCEAWTPRDTQELPSSDEIRAALSLGTHFVGRRAAAVLPMSLCDVRPCTIDTTVELDPRAAVLRELDTVYGDTEAARDVDFWSAGQAADSASSQEELFALSLPALWTARVAQDLTEARLVGQALDGLPLALGRAALLSHPATSGPLAVVDWGYRRATLCIVLGGRPLFVRCLRESGFAAVVTALCKTLSVTSDEAQQLLVTRGLPALDSNGSDELSVVIRDVIREPLDAFVEELNRTLAFLQQQRRAAVPGRLVLLGGGATIRNIEGHLQAHLPPALLAPAMALSALAWEAK